MIFTQINSALILFSELKARDTLSKKLNEVKINNMPVGEEIKFLAVASKNNKIYATLTDKIKIKENHSEVLSLSEVSENEFEKMMARIKKE